MTADQIAVVEQALGLPTVRPATVQNLARAIGQPTGSHAFLILAVVSGRAPTGEGIRQFLRDWRTAGLCTAITRLPWLDRVAGRRARVRVVQSPVVDVSDTARTRYTTGIQRVARETLSRWSPSDGVELMVWDRRRRTWIGADHDEALRAAGGALPSRAGDVIIPFRSEFLLPEIAVDTDRAAALQALAEWSGSFTVAIGFDCIPVTTAETAGPGMPGAFSRYLTALARFSVVVPISDAAGREFEGWRRMLVGAGLRGPDVRVLTLPTRVRTSSPGVSEEGNHEQHTVSEPLVLGVGSREPRKNHLNFLHACELVWQTGRSFAVVLVGGNAWETRRVDGLIDELRRRGRSIDVLTGADDAVLARLYEQSRFSVFCSFNEGFGLPVVESLSHGTPVVTSFFGSMAELGSGRGAVTVDPRDPRAMAETLTRMLDDDSLIEHLSTQIRAIEGATWDDYAAGVRRALSSRRDHARDA